MKLFHCTDDKQVFESIKEDGLGKSPTLKELADNYSEIREILPVKFQRDIPEQETIEPRKDWVLKMQEILNKYLGDSFCMETFTQDEPDMDCSFGFEVKLPAGAILLDDGMKRWGEVDILLRKPIPPKNLRILTDADFGDEMYNPQPQIVVTPAILRKAVRAALDQSASDWIADAYAEMAIEKANRHANHRAWNAHAVAASRYVHFDGSADDETCVASNKGSEIDNRNVGGAGYKPPRRPELPAGLTKIFSKSFADGGDIPLQLVLGQLIDVCLSNFAEHGRLNVGGLGVVETDDKAFLGLFQKTVEKVSGQKVVGAVDWSAKVEVSVYVAKAFVAEAKAHFGNSLI
jgi:hypothetical protein